MGAGAVIAQTLVEYGALQFISAALLNAYHRLELYIVNPKYLLLLLVAAVIVLICRRRRTA